MSPLSFILRKARRVLNQIFCPRNSLLAISTVPRSSAATSGDAYKLTMEPSSPNAALAVSGLFNRSLLRRKLQYLVRSLRSHRRHAPYLFVLLFAAVATVFRKPAKRSRSTKGRRPRPSLVALLRSVRFRERMASWLGLASTRFTHAPTPLVLRSKDGQERTLPDLVQAGTPTCWLNPFLWNGHLQTMWTGFNPEGPPVFYRRHVFESDHPIYHGSFAVDFAVDPHKDHDKPLPPRTAHYSEEDFSALGDDDTRPMLFVLHGLSGGSYELYLRETIWPLISNGSEWDVLVVNGRGCARSSVTGAVLFNARATWDLRQTVKWARGKYPNRPFFGIGFSLGANILTNYVGEEGASCDFKAAVAVSNPFDLELSSKSLHSSYLGRNVYSKVMAGNLKKLILRHREGLEKANSELNLDVVAKTTYLYEFDRAVQCPSWGYPTESAYYRDASSCDAVLGIRVPFLALNAADDPITHEVGVPYEEFRVNPYTVHLSTSMGGHLSWFELGGGRWHVRPIENFLRAMVNLDFDKPDVKSCLEPKAADASGFDPLRRRMKVPVP